MSDRELVESYDEDLDTLLDEAGFAEDANDPGEDEEFPESDGVTAADQIGDGADEADGNESDAPASAAKSPNMEAEEARRYAAELERMIAMKAAQDQEARNRDMARKLQELQQTMTPDEWANTQSYLLATQVRSLQGQLAQVQQVTAEQRFHEEEFKAREFVLDTIVDKFRPNRVELALLEACETPNQIRRVMDEIKQTRKDRTQAARDAKRGQRLASGADVTGGRGRGAGSPPPKQFANVDELVDSMFR